MSVSRLLKLRVATDMNIDAYGLSFLGFVGQGNARSHFLQCKHKPYSLSPSIHNSNARVEIVPLSHAHFTKKIPDLCIFYCRKKKQLHLSHTLYCHRVSFYTSKCAIFWKKNRISSPITRMSLFRWRGNFEKFGFAFEDLVSFSHHHWANHDHLKLLAVTYSSILHFNSHLIIHFAFQLSLNHQFCISTPRSLSWGG